MYVHNLYVRKQPSSYFVMIVLALFKLCQLHIPLHFLSGFTYIFETINIFLMDIIIFFQISFKFTKFSSNINRVKASKSFSAILTIFNFFSCSGIWKKESALGLKFCNILTVCMHNVLLEQKSIVSQISPNGCLRKTFDFKCKSLNVLT